MAHHTLKELQTAKAKLEAEKSRLSSELNTCTQRLSQIHSKIEMATAVPIVSEHAVLRYLERKSNIDIDAIKAEILTDETANKIKELGSGKFPIGDGLRAVVKRNVIVSIVGEIKK